MNYFIKQNTLKGIITLSLCILCSLVSAQDELINSVKVAIKAGNHKDLVNHFNEMIDLGFDGEKRSYSKTQAEFVLKDFFIKYPPTDFQYVHKGASKEGLTYTIGNYQSKSTAFRVLVYIKDFKGAYKIDYLDFSRE